ncbi:MAG: substrate-binding domain-containing protein [Spirochaetales bacterium]|nr:substrate-binding domain-containing protein [Spirochaetales bacterium]
MTKGLTPPISIGLICEYMHNPFHTAIISGLSDASRIRGAQFWCFEFSATNYDLDKIRPETMENLIAKRNLDALAFLPGTLEAHFSSKLFTPFFENHRDMPMAALASQSLPVPSLHINNHEGMKKLMFHLVVEHGFRKLAFLAGLKEIVDFEERLNSFLSLSKEYGINIEESAIFRGKYDFNCGRQGVHALIHDRGLRPEVILAVNDHMAAGAILELRQLGFNVPGDIAVTGFDNTNSAIYADPPLTTIDQPLRKMSFTLADYLFDMIDEKEVPRETIITPGLIKRQSCGCPEPVQNQEESSLKNEYLFNQTQDISHKSREITSYRNTTLNKIMQYLGHHYMEADLTLQLTAQNIGLSSRHISRVIHHSYRLGFKQMLNKIRCAEARRLLSETDLFITDIAFHVGYNSRTHFSRAFAQAEGLSPQEFRQKQIKAPDWPV